MAKGWILQSSIKRSSKIRKLYRPGPLDPIRVYCFLRACVDNWGMMPGDKWTLKAELGPEDEHHTPEEYRKAIDTLIDVGLVYEWEHQEAPWLYVIGHDELNGQYLRKRKGEPQVPRPDVDAMLAESGRHDGGNGDATMAPMDRDMDREKEREGEGVGQAEKIPSPETQISEVPNKGPTVNPEPLPIARTGQPAQAPSPPMGTGKGTSQEADHRGRSPRTSPQVSPSLADQPPPPQGVERDGLPRSPQGSEKKIHVSDKTPPTSGQHGTPPPHPAQAHEKTSRAPRGDAPTKLKEILESQLGHAQIPIKADSNEKVEVIELQQYYANLWGCEISPTLPAGDNLLRVLEVLRHPSGGWDVCKAVIRGHKIVAGKDGSQYGRDFRHAFPPLREGGRQQTARVDLDRVFEYAQAGRPRKKIEEKPEPRLSPEEEKQMRDRGPENVKKAREYLKSREGSK